MTRRGPTRSTRIPTTGASAPCTIDEIENAAAVAPRDQPDSSSSATKKTGNEKKRPDAIAGVTHTTPTTIHGTRAARAETGEFRIGADPRSGPTRSQPASLAIPRTASAQSGLLA